LNKFCDQIIVDSIEEDEHLDIDKKILTKAREDSHIVQDSLNTEEGQKMPYFSALRLWPQTFDTEGFFAVRLKKIARTKERALWEKKPHHHEVISNHRMQDIASQLKNRYGTSFFHDDEALIESREQLFVPKKLLTFKLPLVPYYTGLPFGKLADRDGGVRLSHDILTLRGGEATQNVYSASEDEVRTFLSGGTLIPTNHDCTDGDILLRYHHASLSSPLTIGKGMLKDGCILNRLPRDMVQLFAGR
jgi:16S rRNA (cytosine1407-C5)-methyltransferase